MCLLLRVLPMPCAIAITPSLSIYNFAGGVLPWMNFRTSFRNTNLFAAVLPDTNSDSFDDCAIVCWALALASTGMPTWRANVVCDLAWCWICWSIYDLFCDLRNLHVLYANEYKITSSGIKRFSWWVCTGTLDRSMILFVRCSVSIELAVEACYFKLFI